MKDPLPIETASQRVTALMTQQVSRKDFLKLVGIGAASIVGLSAVAKGMQALKSPSSAKKAGYGVGAYGK